MALILYVISEDGKENFLCNTCVGDTVNMFTSRLQKSVYNLFNGVCEKIHCITYEVTYNGFNDGFIGETIIDLERHEDGARICIIDSNGGYHLITDVIQSVPADFVENNLGRLFSIC